MVYPFTVPQHPIEARHTLYFPITMLEEVGLAVERTGWEVPPVSNLVDDFSNW